MEKKVHIGFEIEEEYRDLIDEEAKLYGERRSRSEHLAWIIKSHFHKRSLLRSLWATIKSLLGFHPSSSNGGSPIVSSGPSGVGGPFQKEILG